MKQNIIIFFGGCSSEYEVSLESAYSVIKNLDRSKYQPVLVGISKEGNWLYFTGDIEKIKKDTWQNETDCVSALLSPDRNCHKLLLLEKTGIKELTVDAAFPVLHGKNGEDGTLQGLLALSGIPVVGCNVLASALCMDKDRAHKLAAAAGIKVPESMVFTKASKEKAVMAFARHIGYPLFIKPVKAGSSYGVTKVMNKTEVADAISLAFQYDDQIIMEEMIDGFEVGCAIMGNEVLTTGEVDEIELSEGFFDYTEKYTLKTSAIHVPARIPEEKAEEIKEVSKTIYKALGCTVFARVDLFLTPRGEIYFNEVNTIPGFTEHSRFPGMMKAAGISFPEILSAIIDLAVKQ